jgi:lipopolysaccharide transport system ATP-binding protein
MTTAPAPAPQPPAAARLTELPQELPPELAVQAEGLSKCYRIYSHPRDRLLQAVWGRDRRGRVKRYYREFWALQELSFSLGRGQTLGVVGRNGSGKSTLLQLLCGTLEPSSGQVRMRGRVGALLELGSGFNQEFSGLENVFLNAALLGLSQRDVEARLDQILAFADIGDFIHQPVKTYSSGMAVRLAFAVQAHIDPDVLVVDEALAVGDELFQKKCYAHLERLKEQGTAVLLVTHSCPQIIQHCDRALLLHKGRARMLGEPAKVTVTYQRLINASDAEWDAAFAQTSPHGPALPAQTDRPAGDTGETGDTEATGSGRTQAGSEEAWLDPQLVPQSTEIYPSHGGRITDAWIERLDTAAGTSAAGSAAAAAERANVLPFGDAFAVVFSYEAEADLRQVAFACHIASHTGQRITGQSVPEGIGPEAGGHLRHIPAGSRWRVRFRFRGGLWPGLYFIGGGIVKFDEQGRSFVHRVVDFLALRVLEPGAISVIGACALHAGPAEVEGLASWPTPSASRRERAGT